MANKTPNLRFYREQNHFSQEKLAELSKVSRSTIVRLERGESANISQIDLLAVHLDMSTELLLNKDKLNCEENDYSIYDVNDPIISCTKIRIEREPIGVLTKNQENRIRQFATVFSDVCPDDPENWIDDFKRDGNPEIEISIWEKMANAYVVLNKMYSFSNEMKFEVYQYLIKRSQNSKKQMKMFQFDKLSLSIINNIETHYKHRGTPLVLQTKNNELITARII